MHHSNEIYQGLRTKYQKLNGLVFTGENFSTYNIVASFRNCVFNNTNMNEIRTHNVCFNETNFNNVEFKKSYFDQTIFINSIFKNTDFSNSNFSRFLSNVDGFRNCSIIDCYYNNTRAGNMIFKKCEVSNTSFKKSKYECFILDNTKFNNNDMTGCEINKLKIVGKFGFNNKMNFTTNTIESPLLIKYRLAVAGVKCTNNDPIYQLCYKVGKLF